MYNDSVSWRWPASVGPCFGQAWAQRFCLLTRSPVFSTDQVACADPETCLKVCSNPSGCSDIAYPKLVLELLPTGNVPSPLNSVPWSVQKGRPPLGPDLKEGQDGRVAGASEPGPPNKTRVLALQGFLPDSPQPASAPPHGSPEFCLLPVAPTGNSWRYGSGVMVS